MIYTDMHTDTLTACADRSSDLVGYEGQTNLTKLKKVTCAAQCFAIFTEGESAAFDFEKYLAYYKQNMPKLRHIAAPIANYSDILQCEREGKVGIILTVENLGFIGSDLDKIDRLKKEGVKMASLVWNNKNLLASPNLVFENGLPQFEKRVDEGLTALGKEAVERLDNNEIIIDISHLSDGGARDILNGRKIPIVASHSNAQSVLNVCRNLSDELIKKIADCGGVIGVNFCKDFLGTPAFDCTLKNVRHLISVGGEDVIAIGSDFDGIPVNPEIPDCTRVPALLNYLIDSGIPNSTVEKFAYKNFLRVFKEVCG
ncbi:MAG: membrane dipeptidase [Clostridia bacterium]|nr:membrane dipeptidase [Clostridia bacterium]